MTLSNSEGSDNSPWPCQVAMAFATIQNITCTVLVKKQQHISRFYKRQAVNFYFEEKQHEKDRTMRNLAVFCGKISCCLPQKRSSLLEYETLKTGKI